MRGSSPPPDDTARQACKKQDDQHAGLQRVHPPFGERFRIEETTESAPRQAAALPQGRVCCLFSDAICGGPAWIQSMHSTVARLWCLFVLTPERQRGNCGFSSMRRRKRMRLGAGALAAIMVAIVSFAVGASPLMKSSSPSESISSRISLFRQVLLYAKEGSRKLVDGRWNLGQSESKLGIKLSADETKQLMACTGNIVCETPGVEGDGDEVEYEAAVKVTATAVSVLRPDLLVTAKHVLFQGQKSSGALCSCSFRSYSSRKIAIPVVVEKDQRRGYAFQQ